MNAEQVEQQTAPDDTNKAQITLNMLRQWGACSDGKSWFSEKFPQGAEYGETMTALYADKKYGDARWLARNVFDRMFSREIVISDVNSLIAFTQSADTGENSSGDGAQIGSSGYGAQIGSSGYGTRIGSSGDGTRIGSSGDGTRIGSSGDGAQIGSSGDGDQIGSSGYGAQIGSSGYGARIGSSGYGAQIGSSGDCAQIGSSGYGARIEATGENAIVACSGKYAKVKLGKGGAACLNWHDGKRTRFVAIYEGENDIKPDVWYQIDESGRVSEVEAA